MKKRKTMKNDEQPGIDVPEEIEQAFSEIVGLTDEFCRRYLNEEYRQLCADMAAELCQLEVPLNRGRQDGWASGIVHAVGFVNFLQDPTQSPHMASADIAAGFSISQGTMKSRSKIIRDELDLIQLDPDWCLESLLDDNPLVWMLEIDGMAVDIRTAPREAQEEAYRMGLIPYVPADREKPAPQSDSGPRIIQFSSAADGAKDQHSGLLDGPSE